MLRHLLVFALLATLAACGTVGDYYKQAAGDLKSEWDDRLNTNTRKRFERNQEAQRTNDPVSLLVHQTTIEADATTSDIEVVVPLTRANKSWPYQQVAPHQHPSLAKGFTNNKVVEIGVRADDGLRLTSTPVIAKGIIYTLDGKGKIRAKSLDDPEKTIWNAHIKNADKNRYLGGNIALGDGKLFVTTVQGDVLALTLNTGELIWEKQLHLPLKSPPMIYQGNLFISTSNSQLIVLDGKDGSTQWVHRGIPSKRQSYGTPTPLATEGVVIAAYPSGEIYALKSVNGDVIWRDFTSDAGLKPHHVVFDTDATPVIYRNGLFVVGNTIRGYHLYTGKKWWQRAISSNKTPWITKDFLYVMSDQNELACLILDSGRIKWVVKFPEGKWSAPVLAGGYLRVVAANGKLATVNPQNGKAVDVIDVIKHVYLPPIIVNNRLVLLSNNAEMQVLE